MAVSTKADFNGPVTMGVGTASPLSSPSPHKQTATLQQFLKEFYGQPPTASHSAKFRADKKNWHEYKLRVVAPDLKSKSSVARLGARPKAAARTRESVDRETTRTLPTSAPVGPSCDNSRADRGAAKSTEVVMSPTTSTDVVSDPPRSLSDNVMISTAVPQTPHLPVGLLFSGQGSQYVGMLSIVKDLPGVQSMLSRAKDILGWDVLELCLEDRDNKLDQTVFCQPVMFIAGLAGLEKLRGIREDATTCFQATAGLSLGEYTALCAAGVFSFEDGLRLVQLRGQAMEEAAAVSKQLMLSVAGLGRDQLEALCREVASRDSDPNSVCVIANELFPKGLVAAGTEKAILALEVLAQETGALQTRILKTSGAFHTSLMSPAQEKLDKALNAVLPRMRPPKYTVYMNVTAEPCAPGTDPAVIVNMLKRQVTSPVLWEASIRNMIRDGVNEFYEVGPQKQLRAMMRRIDTKMFNAMIGVEV
eukprot:TRINITY_DN3005_c0_g1_i1.p1 TRINITY_DN3005_c0_g1~~TRINITY_DN3005_c0_g1_i1.p1  ORF type:complete len:493 (-),score=61.52 TRINITY_DN3005_c0_g1_i1:205-1632(-)